MIKVENIEVWGFEHAVRGMRNPMNSWAKSDSKFKMINVYEIGTADLELMRKLYKGGPVHRKFMRQIFASMDIVAPLYWWKEYDTYKVGTTANSCSTMHKIHEKEFTLGDFSCEHLTAYSKNLLDTMIIDALNMYRENYIVTGDKEDWWQLIQMLPSNYNQRRTVTFTYENAVNMIEYRADHKLDEWREFVDELKKLPILADIMEE